MNAQINNPLFQSLTGLSNIDADDINCSTLTTSGNIDCNGNINVSGNVLSQYTYTEWENDFNTRIATDISFGGNINVNTGKSYHINNVEYFATKTTDNLAQGSTNKYYATSLFDTDLATKTTDNLAEGSNLYYTDDSCYKG